MSNEGALANLDDEAALAEIASGTLSKEIAARYGVTPFAVRKRLAKHPAYAQAIIDQAESFVEDATKTVRDLEQGCDMVAIARARVQADIAYKWAAARHPAWAPKSANITINNNVLAISDSLVGAASDLLGKLRVSGQSELSTVQHEQIAQEIGK